MRLIKVSAPQEASAKVIDLAFSVRIEQVSTHPVEQHQPAAPIARRDVIQIETSTPKATLFTNALLESDFYNSKDFSIANRQPRTIISKMNLRELTVPVVVPVTEIVEELWQFSQITISFVGRFFIAGYLLAFGLIDQKILFIIAGLLFLPLLPLLLAIGFGARARQWNLAGQGAAAFALAVILLFLAGIVIGVSSSPPVRYNEFNSLFVSFFISLAVGIAAALANIDDTGRRELIGLAATSQLAILPVWLGVCLTLGFPSTVERAKILELCAAFLLNVFTIIISSLAVYTLLGAANCELRKNK